MSGHARLLFDWQPLQGYPVILSENPLSSVRSFAATNSLGNVTRFQFDANGNLTNRLDAMNRSTAYSFDGMNRIDRIQYPDTTEATFDYDLNGNLVEQTFQSVQTQFSYDEMNRLASSLISVNSRSFAVTNSYDLNGNRTNIVYPGGLVVGYEYDEENRIKSVTTKYTNDTKTISFTYDGASRLTGMSYPNGVNSAFGYDAESRVTSFSHNNGSNFVQRSIVRDPRGFKTSDDIIQGLEPAFVEGEQRHEHNAADQLTHIDQRDTWLGSQLDQWYNRDYTYNENGCLTQEDINRPEWNTNSAIHEYTTDYTYDYDNRLKTVAGGLPYKNVEYLYDASGVRIGRVASGVTNYFVIDYNAPLKMPLAETDADGNITRYYIWSSHGLLAHMDVNPASGAITATRYYHSDEQSSTLALTDETGAVTDEFAYTPYGTATHTGSGNTPYTWLGGIAVRAEGDGLYYMLNRTYSEPMRRFISSDPNGIDGGANLYAYANLAPTHFTDPFGLCAETGGGFRQSVYNSVGLGWVGKVESTVVNVAQSIHYNRNMSQKGMTPDSPTKAKVKEWDDSVPARYHQQNGAIDNDKWISPNGKMEEVYDSEGRVVTSDENMGTYNYASPITDPAGHFFKDMVPYYLWGNTPNDNTPILNRLFGP